MKAITLFCICIGISTQVAAQRLDSVQFNINLAGDFSFVHKWNYPPNVIKYKSGKFQDLLTGEWVKGADTAHMYQTCACTSDFQGLHDVKYCEARLKGDTLQLMFTGYDGLGALGLSIINGLVKGKFHYTFEARSKKDLFEITRQEITLNTRTFRKGGKIKGRIKVTFNEGAGSDEHLIAGLFCTTVH